MCAEDARSIRARVVVGLVGVNNVISFGLRAREDLEVQNTDAMSWIVQRGDIPAARF